MALLGAGARWVLHHRRGRAWRLGANLAAATGMLGIAATTGADADDLGLRGRHLGRGGRVGSAAGATVAAVIAGSIAVPAVHRSASPLTGQASPQHDSLLFEALVRIPLGTALAEELMFRSALLGVLARRWPRSRAVAVSSLAFGLWHLPPLFGDRDDDAEIELLHVIGTAAATTAAGFAFAWLRFRGNSVIAPALAHAATNAVGLLAATASQRRGA